MFLMCPLTLTSPSLYPPADRPPLMAVTPGVEDGRVYFICSGPIGGLFVFLQSGVGRSGTIPLFIPLSVNAAHIPGGSFASPPRKWGTLAVLGVECQILAMELACTKFNKETVMFLSLSCSMYTGGFVCGVLRKTKAEVLQLGKPCSYRQNTRKLRKLFCKYRQKAKGVFPEDRPKTGWTWLVGFLQFVTHEVAKFM